MNELGNIQHSTFNAEHSMSRWRTPLSTFNVECWLLNVFSNGGLP